MNPPPLKLTASSLDALLNDENTDSDQYALNLHNRGITKIEALNKFTTLRSLDLSFNLIQKVENLNLLKALKELKLYHNRIKKIGDGLKDCKKLERLYLHDNKISDTGISLKNLECLQELRLDNNLLTTTASLGSCKSLVYLDLSKNKLVSLSGLAFLPNLVQLNASGNQIEDISNLPKLPKLEELQLNDNKISDISTIVKFRKLSVLKVNNNKLSAVKLGKAMNEMTELYLQGNRLEASLSILPDMMPNLDVLDLSENRLDSYATVECLRKLGMLVDLWCTGNPIAANSDYRATLVSKFNSLLTLDNQVISEDERAVLKANATQEAETETPVEQKQTETASEKLQKLLVPALKDFDKSTILKKSSSKSSLHSALQGHGHVSIPLVRPMSARSSSHSTLKPIPDLGVESNIRSRFLELRGNMNEMRLDSPSRPSTAPTSTGHASIIRNLRLSKQAAVASNKVDSSTQTPRDEPLEHHEHTGNQSSRTIRSEDSTQTQSQTQSGSGVRQPHPASLTPRWALNTSKDRKQRAGLRKFKLPAARTAARSSDAETR